MKTSPCLVKNIQESPMAHVVVKLNVHTKLKEEPRMKMINVPKGKLAADAAAEERKKIREALLKGDKEVKITQSGDAKPASEVKPGDGNTIVAPKGKLAADVAAEERKKIREALLKGDKEVKITQSGDAKPASEVKPGDGNTIVAPKGKLAADAVAEERKKIREALKSVPIGKLAADTAAEERKELRRILLNGDEIKITQSGDAKPASEVKPGDGNTISVPKGKLAADAAAEERKKIREALLKGDKEVKITQSGDAKPASEVKPGDGNTIVAPKGKLAASMYWYENDPELYREEVMAMNKQFPQFELRKLSDGRLCWIGTVKPVSVRKNAEWMLQLVYDHNHPSNNNYGGSVRVYVIDPDLDAMNKKLGGIPHLLRDASGNIHLCTARREDVRVGRTRSASAVSCLAWAIKWIVVFELWLAGDVSTSEFQNHTF